MIVEVYSACEYGSHLWDYEEFKKHHQAKVKKWNLSGNHINSIIYDIPSTIDVEFTQSMGLLCHVISE